MKFLMNIKTYTSIKKLIKNLSIVQIIKLLVNLIIVFNTNANIQLHFTSDMPFK